MTCENAASCHPSRRQVVTGAGAAAAFAVPGLSACGAGDDGAAAPSGPPITVQAADVPVGGGLIEGEYVVTQPEEGTYKAFSSTCTHQGCKVTRVESEQIVCDCHGSYFSMTDGSVQTGPARDALPEVGVKDADGELTVGG
ncbi:Rieske Fe-S protein [Kytococcus aerolatus]|uniref:Cytochrome bc1 complex Rieske iron-sulfur subunit n=1 Tax=Kytococcus aerolatus TaxID=592308 RepID=A0A212U592_9MICO|nr:Rieske (2Fe-2S) protein [Kytococcus aerolatus]SNC73366.1 Rieske Fe-S protein [Kytococcus aerolatus]